MKQKLNFNAVNQYSRGANIYTEGEDLQSIALLIRGRIQVSHKGVRYVLGSGAFLAVSDIVYGQYQSTYTALEDVIIYVFAVEHKEDFERVLISNSDYNGFLMATLSKVILELAVAYQDSLKQGYTLYEFIIDQYKSYSESAQRLGYTVQRPQWLDELIDIERHIEPDLDKINYYKEYTKIPLDLIKSFYSTSSFITIYQMDDQIELINQLNELLKDLTQKIYFMTQCLIDESNMCLFALIAEFAIEIAGTGGNSDELLDTMDSMVEVINGVESFFNNRLDRELPINRRQMEEAYHLLITGNKDKKISAQTDLKHSIEESEKVVTILADSFLQILNYSEIDETKAEEMQSIMLDFVNLKDRFSNDESARQIRNKLTDMYYELYKAVFIKAYHDKQVPRIIDMFLMYGYADERLLSKEQLISLYFLKDEKTSSEIKVYNIKEWLTLIYEGKKEPSQNEFDQDYNEMLLSMKKRGKITEEQLNQYLNDNEQKLDYEIQNMFRYNNRTTSGQISIFVPVLHKDMFLNLPKKSYLSQDRIIESLEKLTDIDYSIFDREVLYVNKEKQIEKEYIIKKIYPDIILMPIVGTRFIMWQEITGKKRSTPGRFLFPIFCEADLLSNIVKVCGQFRWELCRTIEGTAWNNITYKSLTSEYSDYLQFYRKNRDLSEEKKDKIKLQIQKGRNNSREIFVIDYEAWINYESKGAIKLNKVVREILATYCPFSKSIREQISKQPLFEEAYSRFIRERLKKIKEVEGRHRLLQKEGINPTEEMIDTLKYYQET